MLRQRVQHRLHALDIVERGDIDEGGHRTARVAGSHRVGQDACEIDAPVRRMDLALEHLSAVDGTLQLVDEGRILQQVREIIDGPPEIPVADLEEAARLGRKASQAQRRIDKDGGDGGGLGHAVEVGIESIEDLDLFLILGVDRVKLFVDRLKLFVGALQLLVGGHQLLVGGLQLFVCGLQLLDRRLKTFAGRVELAFERLHALERLSIDIDGFHAAHARARPRNLLEFRLGLEGEQQVRFALNHVERPHH